MVRVIPAIAHLLEKRLRLSSDFFTDLAEMRKPQWNNLTAMKVAVCACAISCQLTGLASATRPRK